MVKIPERWPYHPPEKNVLKPLSDIYRPPGMILLSEAVETVGNWMFGEQ